MKTAREGKDSDEGDDNLAITMELIGHMKTSNRSPSSHQSGVSVKPKIIRGELKGVIKWVWMKKF